MRLAGALLALALTAVACSASRGAERPACEVSTSCSGGKGDAKVDETPSQLDGASPGREVAPLIMFLVDSSQSMERLLDCTCISDRCDECFPVCTSGERNAFAAIIESLTGTWEDFRCETIYREKESGFDFTYDLGWNVPYHRPSGARQGADGILDRYAEDVRFGLATLDGAETYVGPNQVELLVPLTEFDEELSSSPIGMWSYGTLTPSGLRVRSNGHVPGTFRIPRESNVDLRIDTGIRGPSAADGAVMHAASQEEMLQVNDEIQAALQLVRPYESTPLAAALDDLLYYFAEDPDVIGRTIDSWSDRHLILITDGFADDDQRSSGCNCEEEVSQSEPAYCPDSDGSSDQFYCPYPTPPEAAAALLERAFADVHVVRLGSYHWLSAPLCDEIAAAGGTRSARTANSRGELRSALVGIVEEVLGR